jgi:hypothetical protein
MNFDEECERSIKERNEARIKNSAKEDHSNGRRVFFKMKDCKDSMQKREKDKGKGKSGEIQGRF